jgi:hypothetical protein
MILPFGSSLASAMQSPVSTVPSMSTQSPTTSPNADSLINILSVAFAVLAILVSCLLTSLQMLVARSSNARLQELVQGVDEIRRKL